MKINTVVFSVGLAIGSAEASDVSLIKIQDLGHRGVSPLNALTAFESQTGTILNLEDLVKVSYDEEGNGIKLESFDNISVIIPHMEASPADNKGGVGGL